MSRRRGATLIEIVVIAGLLVLAIGAWLALGVSGRGAESKVEEQQELDRLLTALTDRVRRDVRSAASAVREPDGTLKLRVVTGGEAGDPTEVEVVYRAAQGGQTIRREASGETQVYDFKELLKGKELVFDVRP